MTTHPGPFRVLTVCTGNMARSAAAELLLRRGLSGEPSVVVSSAGTRAPVGSGVWSTMADALRARGLDPEPHSARYLTEGIVRDADLVLTASREHRSAVVELAPTALRRAFTLKEFARLAEQVPEAEVAAHAPSGSPADRFRALVTLAAPRRGGVGLDDDLDDPMGHSPKFNERVLGEVEDAVAAILRVVRGPSGQ